MFSSNFYPTPQRLVNRMIAKVNGNPDNVLEPSAGKGDIINALCASRLRLNKKKCYAIENNETLQATLRGMGIKVIDSDFLTYSGRDKFDLIIANPPFDAGDLHLLKALDIMYRGEIIFLINAETLKNPYTNTRKELAARLAKLGALVEYLSGEFLDAERRSNVEVALIYIKIDRKVEDDLFAGAKDKVEEVKPLIEDKHELSTGKTVAELAAEYNAVVDIGMDTIVGYYRNYKKIGKYIGLNIDADKERYATGDMTDKMQAAVNDMLTVIRSDFWHKTLSVEAVSKRLTRKKQDEFITQLAKRCDMEFTESNVMAFFLNIINGYEQTLTAAVIEIFDRFTIKHCYSGGLYDDNIHLFNGWKTNKAFKVNKKVIIPFSEKAFINGTGRFELDYDVASQLDDIDKVMNYFDGMDKYLSIADAIKQALISNQTSKIESTYFTVTVHKKGTVHLVFNSDDILRRFNMTACKGKKWLPDDYGTRPYVDMRQTEKDIVNSFDGELIYTQNINSPVFAKKATVLKLIA